MKLTLTLASLLLSLNLLRAEVERSEIATKGDWVISSCSDGGKTAGTEMRRTYPSKHEVHLRLTIAADGAVLLDAINSELGFGDGKTAAVELRVNNAEGDPLWSGKGTAIEDADGLSWLRVNLGKSAEGDVTERVLEALNDGGKTLHMSVGKKPIEWKFDLKGTKAAYDAMWEANQKGDGDAEPKEEAAAPAAGKAGALVEHEYARPGDWGVHWYSSKGGKFARASMIRFYDNGSMLRMSIDDTHFHIDVAGDWKAMETSEGKEGNKVPVYIVLSEQDDGNGLNENAKLISDEGDKWLRISQSLEEPGGMQDLVRNGKKMQIIFSTEGKWSFDLQGSHAAWHKVDECIEKNNQ